MGSICITLPDGKQLESSAGSSVLSVVEAIGPGLARAALAARVDGRQVDLAHRLESDAALEVLTFDHPEGQEVYWHSTSHLMAQAIKDLYPETCLTIGPPTQNGYYYDFDKPTPFSEDDLARIETRMAELVRADLPIHRRDLSRDEALKLFTQRGESYKIELIEGIAGDEPLSVYEQGNFVDLCRGPHVPSTGKIKAFKLLNIAGAYWRGDEKNKMLQRIYGISFPAQKQLDEFIARREEAERRDHRKLGRQMGLFMFHPFAPASPFFFPKGARLYNTLIDYLQKLYIEYGYEEVITPLIYEAELWKISGHYDHFWHEMFTINADEREYAPKAMNCPSHCLMYAAGHHSYRDLPVRYADFARLHRYERSGVTAGLMRVRSFAQDDGHIFCRPDQIQNEIHNFMKMLKQTYTLLGFKNVDIYLSTRPEHRTGSDEIWDRAETTLSDVLHALDITHQVAPGDGAFYGPKIDIFVRDALNRPWQLGTCQLDYTMPERFGLEYIAESGAPERPAMIHRAILGSLERFLGVYIEHCAGVFPTWLAPVQIVVIGISEKQTAYVQQAARTLTGAGFRVEVDIRNEKVGYKIREAETGKIPFMAVVGAREMESESVSVRRHGQDDLGVMTLDAFIRYVQDDIEQAVSASAQG